MTSEYFSTVIITNITMYVDIIILYSCVFDAQLKLVESLLEMLKIFSSNQ